MILFEIKEKPDGAAQVNMAKGGRGKLTRDHLPPVDKRELERLKKDANTVSFKSLPRRM